MWMWEKAKVEINVTTRQMKVARQTKGGGSVVCTMMGVGLCDCRMEALGERIYYIRTGGKLQLGFLPYTQ